MSTAPVREPTNPTPTGQLSSAEWSAQLIAAINSLLPKGSKPILVTNTNIANLERIITAESAGQQGGYLRDNNPFNLNTYREKHNSLPGGYIVPEWGIYVQKFNTVEDGVLETAKTLVAPNNSATIAALRANAPASVFGGALSSGSWSSGRYANSVKFPKLSPAHVSGTGVPLTVNPTGEAGQINSFLNRTVLPGLSSTENAAKDTIGAVSSVGGLISKLTDPSNLKNIGIFILGLGLTITGLVIVFSSTRQASEVRHVATKAAVAA